MYRLQWHTLAGTSFRSFSDSPMEWQVLQIESHYQFRTVDQQLN